MNEKINRFWDILTNFGLANCCKYYFYLHFNEEKYICLLYKELKSILRPVLNEYKNKSYLYKETGKCRYNIWVCWWQGEQNMPDVVKACFRNLKKNAPDDASVVLIDKNNYKLYVDIPEYIIDHLENNRITITTFSDILRQSLLARSGGLWIDATLLLKKKLPNNFLGDGRFWSIRCKTKSNYGRGVNISQGKWSGFIQRTGAENIVNLFTRDALFYYYGKYDFTLDYFIQNLIMKIGYEEIPSFKEQIDSIVDDSKNIYELGEIINEKYDEERWNSMNDFFYKLNYKEQFVTQIEGEYTYYGYIMNSLLNK